MDWIKQVVAIKSKLLKSGFREASERITSAQMMLGTSGEMYLEVMNELLDLKKRSPDQYQLIEREVNELLDYGKKLNYFNPM